MKRNNRKRQRTPKPRKTPELYPVRSARPCFEGMARRTVSTFTPVYQAEGRDPADAAALYSASAQAAAGMAERNDQQVGPNGRFLLLVFGLNDRVCAAFDVPTHGLKDDKWGYEHLDFAAAARAMCADEVALSYWSFAKGAQIFAHQGTLDILRNAATDLQYHHVRVRDIVICSADRGAVVSLAELGVFKPDKAPKTEATAA